MGLTWSKRVAVANYIMAMTPMKRIFGVNKQLTTKKPIAKEYMIRSEEYLASLGIPQALDSIAVIRKSKAIFGEKEWNVLMRIVEAKGELVSLDVIADLQWGEGEYGSIWTTNKIVQRIRKKLSVIGVVPGKLKTVRGQGFVWIE